MLNNLIYTFPFLLFLSLSSCTTEEKTNIKNKTEKTSEIKEIKRSGYYEEKYPNGQIWSSCHYKKGLKHGKVTSFYPNGKLRYAGFYKNDIKTDIWLFYNEEGQFVKEVNFNQKKEN